MRYIKFETLEGEVGLSRELSISCERWFDTRLYCIKEIIETKGCDAVADLGEGAGGDRPPLRENFFDFFQQK